MVDSPLDVAKTPQQGWRGVHGVLRGISIASYIGNDWAVIDAAFMLVSGGLGLVVGG